MHSYVQISPSKRTESAASVYAQRVNSASEPVLVYLPPMRMADPENTEHGRMLLDEISPAVMVLRTPLVEESCRTNDLSLIEMLAPFSTFSNIDGTICIAWATNLSCWFMHRLVVHRRFGLFNF